MPKLQAAKRRDKKGNVKVYNRVSVNIPKEYTDILGWIAGDTVIIESDLKSKTIILKKAK